MKNDEIVDAVADKCKPAPETNVGGFERSAIATARFDLERLIEFVRGGSGEQAAKAESFLLKSLLAIGHSLLTAFFEAHRDGRTAEVIPGEDGVLYRYWGQRTRSYFSVFGKVALTRGYYYDKEKRAGIFPMDGRLNLPEAEYSHFLMELVEGLAARVPFDEAKQTIGRFLGIVLSKRPIEDAARAVSAVVPEFYRELPAPEPSSEGSILVATADGKGIPMRKEDRPAASTDPERPGEKKESVVTAVYTVDPYVRSPDEVVSAVMEERAPETAEGQRKAATTARPRPKNKLVRGTLMGKDSAFEELTHLVERRDPDEKKTRVFLADGDRGLRKKAPDYLWSFTVILDIFHVLTYLWAAASVFHAAESKEAREWVRERLLKILKGRVSDVVRGLNQSVTKRELAGQARKIVERSVHYFESNAPFMKYHEYLAAGLPIGSGVVEGACRHLVKDRLERTGMRWRVAGAEAILQLRSAEINGHFPALWAAYEERERSRLYPQAHASPVFMPRNVHRAA